MWESNKDVERLYANHGAQQVYATFNGISGWKRVKPGSPDGVGNVTEVLSVAKSHGRKVNVFINNNMIERALML